MVVLGASKPLPVVVARGRGPYREGDSLETTAATRPDLDLLHLSVTGNAFRCRPVWISYFFAASRSLNWRVPFVTCQLISVVLYPCIHLLYQVGLRVFADLKFCLRS